MLAAYCVAMPTWANEVKSTDSSVSQQQATATKLPSENISAPNKNIQDKSKPNKGAISLAFLEYLAELEQVDGKLVHPTELSDDEQVISTKAKDSNTPKSAQDKEQK